MFPLHLFPFFFFQNSTITKTTTCSESSDSSTHYASNSTFTTESLRLANAPGVGSILCATNHAFNRSQHSFFLFSLFLSPLWRKKKTAPGFFYKCGQAQTNLNLCFRSTHAKKKITGTTASHATGSAPCALSYSQTMIPSPTQPCTHICCATVASRVPSITVLSHGEPLRHHKNCRCSTGYTVRLASTAPKRRNTRFSAQLGNLAGELLATRRRAKKEAGVTSVAVESFESTEGLW